MFETQPFTCAHECSIMFWLVHLFEFKWRIKGLAGSDTRGRENKYRKIKALDKIFGYWNFTNCIARITSIQLYLIS